MKKIAFIGAGNMGGALIVGTSKAIGGENVVIYDTDGEKCIALQEKTGCIVAQSAVDASRRAEYVVLAVKPQIIKSVLDEIRPDMISRMGTTEQKLVSIAAGVTLDSLSQPFKAAGCDIPVIRMLPNTPCEISQGLIIYCSNDKADSGVCGEIDSMFARCGMVEHISENVLDTASAISGCTPAFAYMFIEALADGAVRSGLPRDKAIAYAAQAVMGSAAMVLETGRHPDALKDAVCSPGGSTIVGVATLEDSAFRAAAANAVFNANEKNKSLGK